MDILWDGKDYHGNKAIPGIYIYKFLVRNILGKTTTRVQKLIIR